MGGLLHLVLYSEEENGRGRSPPSPLLAVPNVTAHPSTDSVLITDTLLSCCAVLMSFKGLTSSDAAHSKALCALVNPVVVTTLFLMSFLHRR